MMKIEIDGVKLDIPESWKDVRISDYERWYMMNTNTKMELVHYTAKVCNIEVSILLESPPAFFERIFETIQFIFDTQIEVRGKLEIENQVFFISEFNKLTFGEYVDVDSILNSESKSKLSEILAVVCRPVGERYNPENDELNAERINLFKGLTCDKVLPILSFFFLNRSESNRISNHYSRIEEGVNQLLRHIVSSVLNGAGTKRLPIWQGIKYYFLMKSLRKKLLRFSAFCSTK